MRTNCQNYVLSRQRTEEIWFINTADFFKVIPSLQTYRSSFKQVCIDATFYSGFLLKHDLQKS